MLVASTPLVRIPIMHSRMPPVSARKKRVVAKTAHAVYALAHAANLIDGTQRARAMVSVAQAINETSGATESSSRAAP